MELNGWASHRCSAAPVPAAAPSELTAATTASRTTHRNLSLPKAVAPASRPDEISAVTGGYGIEFKKAGGRADRVDMRMPRPRPARLMDAASCDKNVLTTPVAFRDGPPR